MCVTFFINAYKQHRRLLCVLSPRNGNKDLYEDEDMRFNVPQILEFSALGYITYQNSKPAGLSLEFKIWRLNFITDLILVNVQIIFYLFLVSRLALWNEPKIKLKCHTVRLDQYFWPLTASITSEVNINYTQLCYHARYLQQIH